MAVIDFGGATLPYGTTLPIGATNYNMGAAPTATGDSTFSNTNVGGLSGALAGNTPATPTSAPAYTPMPATLDEWQAQQQQNGNLMATVLNPWVGTTDANGTFIRNPDQNAAYAAYAAQQNAANAPQPVGIVSPAMGQQPNGSWDYGTATPIQNSAPAAGTGGLTSLVPAAPQANVNYSSVPTVSSPGLNQPKTASPGLTQPAMSSPGLNPPVTAPVNNVPHWWEPQYIQQQQSQMQQQPSPVQAASQPPVNPSMNNVARPAQDMQRRGLGGLGSLNRQPKSLAVPLSRPTFRR